MRVNMCNCNRVSTPYNLHEVTYPPFPLSALCAPTPVWLHARAYVIFMALLVLP